MKITLTIFLSVFIFLFNSFSQEDEQLIIPRDDYYTLQKTYEKLKGEYPYIKMVEANLPENVLADTNLTYAEYGKRKLRADVFKPKNENHNKLPAVLLVHGGGWRSGDISLLIPLAQKIAAENFVTVCIEYRLSPEANYPASVYDIKAAVKWMRANADKYKIDSIKIAILGSSSGGQLAALVGMTNGLQKFESKDENNFCSSDVQAIIDVDGLVDFTSEEARKYEDDPKKNPSSAGAWFGGNYAQKKELWKEASPLYYVNSSSPPTLFINSAQERFHCGRDEMIEKLNEYNIYSEVQTIPNTPHSFWLFHPWFEPTLNYALNFLKKIFK